MSNVQNVGQRAASLLAAFVLICGGTAPAQEAVLQAPSETDALPMRLSDTGLYEPGTKELRPGILPFTPRFPLWSDGASKRRWLYLPPGASIDASDTDSWAFPRGTRLWKEFSHGRRVETRYIERLADGTWRYATYVWNAEGTEAELAPAAGMKALAVDGVSTGTYEIPSQDDCRACHEGAPVPVLGFSAVQLIADPEPAVPHAEPKRAGDLDLQGLLEKGLLRNLATDTIHTPPELASASPVARAALGYLHANCGHCHNARGPLADIGLDLSQAIADAEAEERVLRTTLDAPADSHVLGLNTRIVAGRPAESQLLARMLSRNPYNQMPPLGTRIADSEAAVVIETWIAQLQEPEGEGL
jgi:hypothetical protein